MKIALIGYGRMGHMIEQTALNRGHEIVAVIDTDNYEEIDSDAFRSADAVIEFSVPSAAADNCLAALKQGAKVVSGTTGWSDRLSEVQSCCSQDSRCAFMWSSNYSIGVNLFRRIAAYASRLMSTESAYRPSLHETHHIHKLDHPSGTAITLAETVIANDQRLTKWSEESGDESILIITHTREGEVPGIHTISWESPADTISITHSAKSREGFALGAVMAAEWLSSHTGVHSIDEMIDDLTGEKMC